MKIIDILYEDACIITEGEMYEMARVKEANSGIPVLIYVSTKMSVKERHGPRIKVSNIKDTFSDNDNFAITISKDPIPIAGQVKLKTATVNDICDWIKLNYVPLMKYWRDEFNNDADFYAEIKSLRNV